MRLTELDPQWLMFEGRRVGFMFRCPLADPDKRRWWQICFVERFYVMKGRDGHYTSDEVGFEPDSQCGIVSACLPEAVDWFQGCNADHCWTVAGCIENANFETMTVTPSLDGSQGGLWHGYITNGEIVGGI